MVLTAKDALLLLQAALDPSIPLRGNGHLWVFHWSDFPGQGYTGKRMVGGNKIQKLVASIGKKICNIFLYYIRNIIYDSIQI